MFVVKEDIDFLNTGTIMMKSCCIAESAGCRSSFQLSNSTFLGKILTDSLRIASVKFY